MLQIKGLVKNYNNFSVLRGLNLCIEKGDVYGFLGTNGCGKTTTMNIICNIVPKDRGEIIFSDNVTIGYLPESPALFGYMNGLEYIEFIGACCEYPGSIQDRTVEVLHLTGMYEHARRKIKGYSRGMIQRIGIAAALFANPDLLILDEPTSALDPEGRVEVINIINGLAASGSTIILCTHILADVERVANKVGILRHGTMAVEGKLSDIKKMFTAGVAVTIRVYDIENTINSLKTLDITENIYTEQNNFVTVVAKEGVKDAELFYKIVTTLATNQIVPEGVWFRHMDLEQIYLGINNGSLLPYNNPEPFFSGGYNNHENGGAI